MKKKLDMNKEAFKGVQKEYKNLYSFYLAGFANHIFSPERLESRISRLKDMIAEAAKEDIYRFIAFEWDMDDFHSSYEEAPGAKIALGLKPFIRTRRKATLYQIMPYTTPTLYASPPIPPEIPGVPEEKDSLPTLVVNEICAGNSSIIQDSFGEYDDWIEIYNYGTEPVSLEGMYLTDDRANPGRHRIPDGIMIQAKEYVLFWADADISQGPYHVNFKLSRNGEMVGLFEKTSQGAREIDLVVFGTQESNVSWGRVEDGQADWRTCTRPTPGASNR